MEIEKPKQYERMKEVNCRKKRYAYTQGLCPIVFRFFWIVYYSCKRGIQNSWHCCCSFGNWFFSCFFRLWISEFSHIFCCRCVHSAQCTMQLQLTKYKNKIHKKTHAQVFYSQSKPLHNKWLYQLETKTKIRKKWEKKRNSFTSSKIGENWTKKIALKSKWMYGVKKTRRAKSWEPYIRKETARKEDKKNCEQQQLKL